MTNFGDLRIYFDQKMLVPIIYRQLSFNKFIELEVLSDNDLLDTENVISDFSVTDWKEETLDLKVNFQESQKGLISAF